jgi:hypothetical protein
MHARNCETTTLPSRFHVTDVPAGARHVASNLSKTRKNCETIRDQILCLNPDIHPILGATARRMQTGTFRDVAFISAGGTR